MPGHFHFFTQQIEETKAVFTNEEYAHMVNVLRYTKGEVISFTNGLGSMFKGEIVHISKKELIVTITESIVLNSIKDLSIAVGILKNMERMELLVEKLTELNVQSIWFMQTANVQRKNISLERLTKKAVSALKQSHGAFLPQIEIKSLTEVLNTANPLYIAYCKPINHKTNINQIPKKACVLLGPEGDFTDNEIEKAFQKHATPLDLGEKILRTETAAIAIASVHYLC